MCDPPGPILWARGDGDAVTVGLGLLDVRVGDGGAEVGRVVVREVVAEGVGLTGSEGAEGVDVVDGFGLADPEGWAA
jgi:hypothetical protein